jgi:MoaA/NifB/PqqE/SkfB family radical SAM enzyme
MCTVGQQRGADQLTLPVIQALAGELAALGTQKIHLSVGEVLLRSDIFEVVAAFARQGTQVNLTTNGTLLGPEAASRLVDSGGNNVSISLDGATPAVHDALRRKRNWKRTIRSIGNLRRAATHARHKVHIRVNFVITRRNYQDIAGLAGADRLTVIPIDDATGRFKLNKSRIRPFPGLLCGLCRLHRRAGCPPPGKAGGRQPSRQRHRRDAIRLPAR